MMVELALAVVAWLAAVQGSHATAPPTAVVHVTMADGTRYDMPVARVGTPMTAIVYDGADPVELRLRVVDLVRVRYHVERSAPVACSLESETGRLGSSPSVPWGNRCEVVAIAMSER